MMAQRNSFINGIGLTEANSLIHLLNNDDTDDDNEVHLIKHSAYYGENEFLNCYQAKRVCLYSVETFKALTQNLMSLALLLTE